MAKFAVAFADLFDNTLSIEIVEADDLLTAIFKHRKISAEDCEGMSSDIEKLKEQFFNQDALIDIVQVS